MTPFQNLSYGTFSGLADWVGGWLDMRPYGDARGISFFTSWSAVAATNGTLYLEGTNDPAKAAANVIRYGGLLWVPSATGIAISTGNVVGATAAGASIGARGCPAFIRHGYARVAGGGAAQFSSFFLIN
jgi:hypothetical protein